MFSKYVFCDPGRRVILISMVDTAKEMTRKITHFKVRELWSVAFSAATHFYNAN